MVVESVTIVMKSVAVVKKFIPNDNDLHVCCRGNETCRCSNEICCHGDKSVAVVMKFVATVAKICMNTVCMYMYIKAQFATSSQLRSQPTFEAGCSFSTLLICGRKF